MVKIVYIKNPFSPAKGRITVLENDGKTLREYCEQFTLLLPPGGAYIELNGAPLTDYTARENERLNDAFIIIGPIVGKSKSGKAIIGVVASIGLAIATGGITSAGVGTGFWAAGHAGAYLAAAAVSMVGGMLINKLCYPQSKTKNADVENTYSWAGVQTIETQGGGVALTYGKVKSGGQTLQKFTTSKGTDQYLNWLLAAGEGPLEISDIRLNNNPVSYYDGVTVETRAGTNDQEIISNFGDTYTPYGVGAELRYLVNGQDSDNTELSENYAGFVEQRLDGNATEGLRFEFEFSSGLYHYSDEGKIKTAWVKVWVQYRKVGATAWADFIDTESGTTIKNTEIKAGVNSAYRVTYQMDNLPAGRYEVRACVCSRSAKTTSSKDMTRVWWSLIESVIYDDFKYPNTALIGIKAKATAQLNAQAPAVTFLKERAKIWAYNPIKKAYEEKPANNPAWAAYDFAHGARRLKGADNNYTFVAYGVPRDLMLYEQFAAWAENCDALNLKINIEITSVNNWLTTCNSEISAVGRGLVVQIGTRYGCIYDHAQTAVQLFNDGNIINGSFELQYLGTEERADAVEIIYTDAAREYERAALTVYAEGYDDLSTPNNPTQIIFNGITDYNQAYREAKYQIYCNKLQRKIATWRADVEAISCQVGDVVLVASDVIQWGINGRISEVLGNKIIIPVDFDNMPAGLLDSDLSLMVRNGNANKLYNYNIVSHTVNGFGDVELITESEPQAEAGDIFVLGKKEATAKPFIITSISRSKDLEYTLTGLEYNEGVYSENYTIPTIDASIASLATAPNISGLNGKQTAYVDGVGTPHALLSLSWRCNSPADNFVIYGRDVSGTEWRIIGETPLLSFETETAANTAIEIKIEGAYKGRKAFSDSITISPGVDMPPPNVGALSQRLLNDGTRLIWWAYDYPTPNDIKGFEFRWSADAGTNWQFAKKLHEGLITSQPFETLIITPQAGAVLCCAVDNAGQYSETPAALQLAGMDTLKNNVVAEWHLADNWNAANITHNGVIVGNELQSQAQSEAWSGPNDAAFISPSSAQWNDAAGYAPINVNATITAPASGALWVEFDSNGRAYCDYKITTKIDGVSVAGSWQPNIQKAQVKAGDIIEIKVTTTNINQIAIIRAIDIFIDVEDRNEHFENIASDANGLITLPISTPNYYTTGLKIDNIQANTSQAVYYDIVSYTPCKIKFYTLTRGATYTQAPASVTASISWQGYIKEVQ